MIDDIECLILRLIQLLRSWDVTVNETTPHDVFESVRDKEMEDNILLDEELQDFEGDKD
jgi:hypothetical protein